MGMADTTNNAGLKSSGWRPDPIWLIILTIPVVIRNLDPVQFRPIVSETLSSFGHTSIFIAFAVLAVAYLKASGAAAMIARVFEGNEVRMIVFAAAFGGPKPWTGKDMRKAHKHLDLTEKDFNVIAEHLQAALKELKVDNVDDYQELKQYGL